MWTFLQTLFSSGSYNPPPSSRRESRIGDGGSAAFVNAGFADINDNVNAGDVERSIKARMAKRDGIMRSVEVVHSWI